MKSISTLAALVLVIAIAVSPACNRHAYTKTNKVYRQQAKRYAQQIKSTPDVKGLVAPEYWVGTTNFNLRKPNFVVIHHTAQNSCEQTLRTFTLARTQVSAHYVICEDGTVHHMLHDNLRAWHGGAATWGLNTDINSASIGIELDNNGFEPFPEAQINSLLTLLDTLKKRHGIPAANFIGHLDIAPTRKNDPSRFFPWETLAQRGFGRWADTSKVTIPLYLPPSYGLRLIGYNTADSAAAIKAFKQHFVPGDTVKGWTPAAEKVMWGLLQQL